MNVNELSNKNVIGNRESAYNPTAARDSLFNPMGGRETCPPQHMNQDMNNDIERDIMMQSHVVEGNQKMARKEPKMSARDKFRLEEEEKEK